MMIPRLKIPARPAPLSALASLGSLRSLASASTGWKLAPAATIGTTRYCIRSPALMLWSNHMQRRIGDRREEIPSSGTDPAPSFGGILLLIGGSAPDLRSRFHRANPTIRLARALGARRSARHQRWHRRERQWTCERLPYSTFGRVCVGSGKASMAEGQRKQGKNRQSDT
jgi:hypothetical protein